MKTYIFDNEGRTFDRYTIVTGEGEVYGSSEHPFHPQGFGQCCGNVIELCEPEHKFLFLNKDSTWQRSAITRYKRQFVNTARRNPEWIGIEISFNNLPNDVQRYVMQLEEEETGIRLIFSRLCK